MNFDSIIKNGLVILENGEQEVEVGIKDGKIAAIGKDCLLYTSPSPRDA